MINANGSIDLSHPTGRPCIVRTPGATLKVKNGIDNKGRVCVGKLGRELRVSCTSMLRILTDNLKNYPYEMVVQPFLTDAHKAERKACGYWVRTNFGKEQAMTILFSYENPDLSPHDHCILDESVGALIGAR